MLFFHDEEEVVQVYEVEVLPALVRQYIDERVLHAAVEEDAEDGLLEVRHDRIERRLVLAYALLIPFKVDRSVRMFDKVTLHLLKNRSCTDHKADSVLYIGVCDSDELLLLRRDYSMKDLCLLCIITATFDTAKEDQCIDTDPLVFRSLRGGSFNSRDYALHATTLIKLIIPNSPCKVVSLPWTAPLI